MIRPAREGEAGILHALVPLAYSPWEAIVGRRPQPMDEDYAARIRAGQAWVFDDHGVVALVILEPGEGWLLLENVAVHPEHQGKGLGGQMIAFAATEARRRGARELRLFTHVLMTSNIARYTHLGFRETHREKVLGYDRVFMTLDLLPSA